MANQDLTLLFSPLTIRGRTLKNRIAVTAHATGLNPLSLPSDEFIAYNLNKAKHGVGLLMTMGSASVHPTSPNSDWGGIHNWDDRIIPYLKRMSEAIKPTGAVLMAQISHRGRRATRDVTWLPTYAPSDEPEPVHRDVPHEIQPEDIEWLVASYVGAAVRLKEGGFDGVEISAAHGHLIDQFWSPLSNRRTDEFGGSLDNRMRFGNLVVDAVREAVGDDFIVGLRITGDEFIDGGLTLEDMQEIAKRMVATGKIDLLNVIGSTGMTEYHQALTVPSMNYRAGVYRGLASSIRYTLQEEGYTIPVLVTGRVIHPLQAEEILASGEADIVGMNRAIIADPEMVEKAAEGRLSDIRLCMGANEGCIGRIYVGKGITCVQNPVIGRERELAEWVPAPRPQHVVVVGGGPAGLEAARMSALRGHRVSLLERAPQLGGQIRIAAKAPHRAAYSSSVEWLESQARKLGVEFYLETEATVDVVLGMHPDAVVVATGSLPRPWTIPTDPAVPCFSAREVLNGRSVFGRQILLIDENHHQEGLSTAEFLAEQDYAVTVISRLWVVGDEIDVTLRPDLYARLDGLGVEIHPLTEALEIRDDGSVLVEHVHSRRQRELGPFDSIVIATKGRAQDQLWRDLKGSVDVLYLIGDAMAPRGLHDAILEGTRVARQIS
ncbi:MAG: NAD-binding protein [Firmicutes bacterium]|nr:NAD-binding protein [Bacillota bacterium]